MKEVDNEELVAISSFLTYSYKAQTITNRFRELIPDALIPIDSAFVMRLVRLFESDSVMS